MYEILQDMPTIGSHDGFQDVINLQIGVLFGKCLYFLALGKQSVDVFPLDMNTCTCSSEYTIEQFDVVGVGELAMEHSCSLEPASVRRQDLTRLSIHRQHWK